MRMQMHSTTVEQSNNIEALKSLSEEDVEKIIIYDDFWGKEIKTITDKQVLDEFIMCCSDIEKFQFNHDRSTHNWDIVLEGKERQCLSIAFIERRPDSAVGMYVKWEPKRITNLGQLQSKNLRRWCEKYLLNDDS